MDRLVAAVEAAARETEGPVVYITRVPEGSPAPEGEAKRRLGMLFPSLLAYCSSYHVVVDGEGFVAAFKRGVLTNLLQPFWRRRMFFVHSRCSDIKSKLLPQEVRAVDAVLDLARARGLTNNGVPPNRPSPFTPRHT